MGDSAKVRTLEEEVTYLKRRVERLEQTNLALILALAAHDEALTEVEDLPLDDVEIQEATESRALNSVESLLDSVVDDHVESSSDETSEDSPVDDTW